MRVCFYLDRQHDAGEQKTKQNIENMKVTIKQTEKPTVLEVNFPALMESKTSDLIVLFISETEGVVIKGGSDYRTGHYSSDWIPCGEKTEWSEFYGVVTLSNK